jgi:hypothetical protein
VGRKTDVHHGLALLVGYLVPSGKKKNLRPMFAMPPSHSPFWDKAGQERRLQKKTWITKRNEILKKI